MFSTKLFLKRKDWIGIAALCAALTFAAIAFRPALPIDETRYLTVAWEMFIHHGYFLPTMNFEPYHHKPPLMFWLINIFWMAFGAHRWGAVLAMSLVSSMCIYLLTKFSRQMFPAHESMNERLPWIMVASAPFVIYGTLIMFDFILAYCVLLTWIFAARFLQTEQYKYTVPAGLALGLGVLAKGPVVILFTLLPLLLAPYWYKSIPSKKKHYLGLLAMFVVALGPVLFWLIPVFLGTSAEFFEWLVFKQTAGRVTGNFGGAHARPFYFYVPVFIALFVPWILFPEFWRRLKDAIPQTKHDDVLRFCFFLIVPAFIVFSLISGKQPHYLVPLSLFVMMLIARLLEGVPLETIKKVSVVMVALMVGGQAVASMGFFKNYNLQPVADMVNHYPDRDWAWTPNYHGELGFLARSKKPVKELPGFDSLPQWFGEHPEGLAVVRYKSPDQIKAYKALLTIDYSADKHLSVIEPLPENP